MSTSSVTAATAALSLDETSAPSLLTASASSMGGSNVSGSINPIVCRYFVRGICRFGDMCRFSHDLGTGDPIATTTFRGHTTTNNNNNSSSGTNERPSTSRRDWASAPVFVPKEKAMSHCVAEDETETDVDTFNGSNRSWADVVGAGVERIGVITEVEPGSMDGTCPYESPCPYGVYCAYSIHLELCKMCDQYCLHPNDQAQRRKHNQECLQQHEQAMELSFAIARSKDKTCGICFDTIIEKSGREKRFGILPNCSHIFCLECIRKWRQAKQFEHKITRSCPECRVASDFVCPSAFWVETKEEKDKLLNDYRTALGVKDCKYFKKGDGKCPFGNKCFYKHALPNGELVDVGCPKRARKLLRSTNEIINLLDIYLYEFVDQRNLDFLDLFTSASEDSDDSDVSDD